MTQQERLLRGEIHRLENALAQAEKEAESMAYALTTGPALRVTVKCERADILEEALDAIDAALSQAREGVLEWSYTLTEGNVQ